MCLIMKNKKLLHNEKHLTIDQRDCYNITLNQVELYIS